MCSEYADSKVRPSPRRAAACVLGGNEGENVLQTSENSATKATANGRHDARIPI